MVRDGTETYTPEPLYPVKEFGRAIAKYQEDSNGSGSLAATDYSSNIGEGKCGHTGSSATIKVSDDDFSVDVYVAARCSLSDGEFAYFNHFYAPYCTRFLDPKCSRYVTQMLVRVVAQTPEAHGDKPCEQLEAHIASFPPERRDAVRSLDLKVRTKLGRRLIHVGIVPFEEYLESIDVRTPRRPKQRWSHLY